MSRESGYRVLCAVSGLLLTIGGLALFVGFFRYHMPGSAGGVGLHVGPNGAYFMAFSGCALVAWGGCLLGAARRPDEAQWVGTCSASALVMMAVYRIFGWLMGDYAALGNTLRVEAALFLCIALGFIWLRPEPKRARATAG